MRRRKPAVTSAELDRLRARAACARIAIRQGADPAVTLSFVVWPTAAMFKAEAAERDDHLRRDAA